MVDSMNPYRDKDHKVPMPSRLRIGHAVYKVVVDNARCADGGLFGESHSARLEIRMSDTYPQTVVADTLLHEVMHQCLSVSGADGLADRLKEGENVEERFILAMSGPLLGALRDNPDLVAFLLADEAA